MRRRKRSSAAICVLMLSILCLCACKRRGSSRVPGAPVSERGRSHHAGPAFLSEAYTSRNGLITTHYPADFAASTTGRSGVVIARNLPGGLDEAISFVSVEHPISNELREFARVVAAAEDATLNRYVEKSSLPATCVGSPGVETIGTWQSKRGRFAYLRKACHFLRGGHGYSISYSLPATHAARDERMLRAIREATTFNW